MPTLATLAIWSKKGDRQPNCNILPPEISSTQLQSLENNRLRCKVIFITNRRRNLRIYEAFCAKRSTLFREKLIVTVLCAADSGGTNTRPGQQI